MAKFEGKTVKATKNVAANAPYLSRMLQGRKREWTV